MNVEKIMHCWCGSERFAPFSDDYLQCRHCNTLLSKTGLTDEELAVGADESAFYGKEYWLSGMAGEGKGFADIFERSRGELVERNLYWCKTILSLKPPPAKILELGCSHGGLLALANAAGYDATGIELSPWVCQFASNTFGVRVLHGPVEVHQLAPGTYDVIALMDVLEHLPDPVSTMKECCRLLKADGCVLVQTPRHIPGRSFKQLQKDEHPFLRMLLPKEHVHLFTDDSVRKLFDQLGLESIQFLPPIFSEYDMYFAASRTKLAVRSQSDIETSLLSGPAGRMVLGLIDLDKKQTATKELLIKSERDRVARLANVNELTERVKVLSSGWAALPLFVHRALASLHRRTLRKTPEAFRKLIIEIDSLRNASEAVADQKLNHLALLEQIKTLHAMLEDSERDRSARMEQIHTLTQWLLEERAKAKVESSGDAPRRIVVDLTPLLPGGENGGAKPMTLELIRTMASRSPQTHFILLTLKRTFDELSAFNQPNVEVVLLDEAITHIPLAIRLIRFIARPVSERIRRGLERRARSFLSRLGRLSPDPQTLVSRHGGSVLFCPFTAPFFAQAGIPTVSVIYDLQYADYPQYFEERDQAQRHQNFVEACRRAARLVCISDFVRRRVLQESGLPEARVTTVHIQLAHRLPPPKPEVAASVLAELALAPGRYLLYPANFWRHKNHEMLFVAMGLFVTRSRASDIKLVCTGAPGERRDFLCSAVGRMGLSEKVVLPGYLSDQEFSALMHGCKALIYPSLYEGFGMPIIEAQAIGKPVLCSNLASLPEVGGDGVLLFDPRLPESIVEAMQRIESDATVGQKLVKSGLENVKRFVDNDAMAARYLGIFEEVVQGSKSRNFELLPATANG